MRVKDSDIFWYQKYTAKLERGPTNLDQSETQKRMRKPPPQITKALTNLVAETHQVWYALGSRWREVLWRFSLFVAVVLWLRKAT